MVLAIIVAACGGEGDAGPVTGEPTAPSSSLGGREPGLSTDAPVTVSVLPCQPAPLEARAALVLMVGIGDDTTADGPTASVASTLGVGGVTLRSPNIVDEDQLRGLIEGLRQRAGGALLVGTDEEGGRVSRLRPVVGASAAARELGRRDLPEIVEAAARRGAAMRDLGVNVNLAPVVDADGGPADGVIGDRAFAATPDAAGLRAAAFASGLSQGGVAATAKHFPGQGGLDDSHDSTVVSDAPLEDVQASAASFVPTITAGVPAVMISHVTFPSVGPMPASLEPAAYAMLRDLGFQGVAITDSLGMGAINLRWPIPDATVLALTAGADLVLANQGEEVTAMRDAVTAAVRDGRLSEQRLDEAVRRVLRLRGEDPATMLCD